MPTEFPNGLSLQGINTFSDRLVNQFSTRVRELLAIENPTAQDYLQMQQAVNEYTLGLSSVSNTMNAMATATRGVIQNFN